MAAFYTRGGLTLTYKLSLFYKLVKYILQRRDVEH